MNTALTTETRLDVLEKEIREAEYEAFFFIGQRLLEIKQKRLFEKAGFRSWSQYCGARRIDYSRSRADRYVQCMELRRILPSARIRADSNEEWNVEQMLELAKCSTDQDAKRVASKVIAHAKKTKERVTAKLIAQIRDGETTKPDKDLETARLEVHLDRLATLLVKWRTSLEVIGLDQWEVVPRDVMKRVVTETDALLTFLRS